MSFDYQDGDYVFVPGIRKMIENGEESIDGYVISGGKQQAVIKLYIKGLTDDERQIILDGCLINYYAERMKKQ